MKSVIAAGLIGFVGVIGAVGCSSAPETLEGKLNAIDGLENVENLVRIAESPEFVSEMIVVCNSGMTPKAFVATRNLDPARRELMTEAFTVVFDEYCAKR